MNDEALAKMVQGEINTLANTMVAVASAAIGVVMVSRLSPRERLAVQLAATGASNKEVAAAMGTTVGTVKGYLHRAYVKLDLRGGRESLK